MGAAGRSFTAHVRQQDSVRLGHAEVVDVDRDSAEDRGDKTLALLPPSPFRHLNADLQLRHGDRRDRDVIAILDRIAQRVAPALRVD